MNLIETFFGKCVRKKECKPHFSEDDIIINNFRLNSVHCLPVKVKSGIELDYYMDTGKDIYLLRLQDKIENKIIFINRDLVNITIKFTYIIVRKKLSENINKELETVINKLNEIGFPKYYEEKTFEIEKWE